MIREGRWRRCEALSLSDGVLRCTLAADNAYDLMASYQSDLHIRFANAKEDRELIEFVKSWGPLWLTDAEKQSGTASIALRDLRTLQRWLKAFLDMLLAFKKAKGEQGALLEFVEAEYQYSRGDEYGSALFFIRDRFGIRGDIDIVDWAKGADLQSIREATDLLVSFTRVHPMLVHLVCLRQRGSRRVEARWVLRDLEDALRWMVFQDEFMKHPVVCCLECRKVFRAESGHVRKYCDYQCAHRATGRVWQRRKRKEERAAARQKGKSK